MNNMRPIDITVLCNDEDGYETDESDISINSSLTVREFEFPTDALEDGADGSIWCVEYYEEEINECKREGRDYRFIHRQD